MKEMIKAEWTNADALDLQSTATDLISRQAALRTDCFGDGHDGLRAFHVYEDYKKMRNYIESLPSVQTERKKGKWIWQGSISEGCWVCSECKHKFYQGYGNENFCQNCGSDMREEGGAK